MIPLLFLAAVAAGVPNYDIGKMCKGATSISNDNAAIDGCVADEKAAKERLIKAWPDYPATARQTCIGNVQLDVGISYVEMETCFQMQNWKMHLDDIGGVHVPGAHGPQLQLQGK